MAESRKARESRPPRTLTAASLENAALFYLSRFASSSGNLRRVLMRKVGRTERLGGDTDGAVPLIDGIIARFLASGLLNDRAYASQAAASLARRGSSRYSIAGKLAQKGVDAELVAEAVATLDAGGETELAAACALVRRRRLGPYRAAGKRADWRQKDLASLARAGFGLDLARRVLRAPDVAALERLARGDDLD
ncbi:MAG TPA: RecX family transcriptional regulator [Stellaceae bacterium]|nr:RecX family transcriptional regulator [Stellaceae bacterium]